MIVGKYLQRRTTISKVGTYLTKSQFVVKSFYLRITLQGIRIQMSAGGKQQT